jgi:predicted nucleic acid-binding protein
MKKRILDTNILIGLWQQRRSNSQAPVTTAKVKSWAKELINLYDTNAIVTPVYLEMLAGVSSKRELGLTRAFLDEFTCIDEGQIPKEDWDNAIRLAARIPRDGRPRQLGDCLIRALADRLRCEVITRDVGFPPASPRKKPTR